MHQSRHDKSDRFDISVFVLQGVCGRKLLLCTVRTKITLV